MESIFIIYMKNKEKSGICKV